AVPAERGEQDPVEDDRRARHRVRLPRLQPSQRQGEPGHREVDRLAAVLARHGENLASAEDGSAYASAAVTCEKTIRRYMSTHEGCVLVPVSAAGSRTRRRTARSPTAPRASEPQKRTKWLPARTPTAAATAIASHGTTRNGATMFTLRST